MDSDHWVLFDTLNDDQMSRLKKVIVKKAPVEPVESGDSNNLLETFDEVLLRKQKLGS